MGEFGVLKAIGFSHRLILSMVAAEAVLPCLAGAVVGLITAKLLFFCLAMALPALERFPAPVYTLPLLATAAVIAIVMGAVSAAIPAARIIRLNVVDALREI
jgi:ABC-type antimicrobial peptide transport system permease subunit